MWNAWTFSWGQAQDWGKSQKFCLNRVSRRREGREGEGKKNKKLCTSLKHLPMTASWTCMHDLSGWKPHSSIWECWNRVGREFTSYIFKAQVQIEETEDWTTEQENRAKKKPHTPGVLYVLYLLPSVIFIKLCFIHHNQHLKEAKGTKLCF